MRAYTPTQCVQSGFYARLCEKRGALAVAKRRLKLLVTDQRRSAFLLPRPLTHLIGFQCLKRARHQRCVCQSAGSHFQFGLSQLFITDKQTFSSARRNARAQQMRGEGMGGGGFQAIMHVHQTRQRRKVHSKEWRVGRHTLTQQRECVTKGSASWVRVCFLRKETEDGQRASVRVRGRDGTYEVRVCLQRPSSLASVAHSQEEPS